MKMRRIVLLIAAAACLAVGCSRSQKFTVQGTLKDIKFAKADTLRLESDQLEKPILAVVNDKDFVIKGKVKNPAIGKIFSNSSRRKSQFLILEKGTISFKDGYACGTPLNDSTVAFTERVKALAHKYPNPEDRELKKEAIEKEFATFVSNHKDDPCATYAILLAKNRIEPKMILKLIDSASPKIQKDGDVDAMKKILTMSVK